jgi:arginine utilization protein RocB
MIIGIAPPLYPGVSNLSFKVDCDYKKLINDYTKNMWNQEYDSEYYFNGISDLSFSSLNYDLEEAERTKTQMPLWGNFYSIPFEDIEKVQMPSLNIGPWGKDLHKISERVFKEDLFDRTPKIIDYVVGKILNETE